MKKVGPTPDEWHNNYQNTTNILGYRVQINYLKHYC